MISVTDRSGYFGASDTKMVLTKNQTSKTWMSWWEVKLGLKCSDFTGSIYTEAGNTYEHSILKAIDPAMNWDRQIIIDDARHLLRVNYDGDLDGYIYEVKTHRLDRDIDIPKDKADMQKHQYWRQCQVEMYCWKTANERGLADAEFKEVPELKGLYLADYPLFADEYGVSFPEDQVYEGKVPVDANRIRLTKIEYDEKWIKKEYLPALKKLTRKLRKEMKNVGNVEHVDVQG